MLISRMARIGETSSIFIRSTISFRGKEQSLAVKIAVLDFVPQSMINLRDHRSIRSIFSRPFTVFTVAENDRFGFVVIRRGLAQSLIPRAV